MKYFKIFTFIFGIVALNTISISVTNSNTETKDGLVVLGDKIVLVTGTDLEYPEGSNLDTIKNANIAIGRVNATADCTTAPTNSSNSIRLKSSANNKNNQILISSSCIELKQTDISSSNIESQITIDTTNNESNLTFRSKNGIGKITHIVDNDLDIQTIDNIQGSNSEIVFTDASMILVDNNYKSINDRQLNADTPAWLKDKERPHAIIFTTNEIPTTKDYTTNKDLLQNQSMIAEFRVNPESDYSKYYMAPKDSQENSDCTESSICEDRYDIVSRYDLPVGSVIWYAGDTLPEGYLLANGNKVDKDKYPRLYNALAPLFGTDGTVRLPNLTQGGKFIRGSQIDVNRIKNDTEGNSALDPIPGAHIATEISTMGYLQFPNLRQVPVLNNQGTKDNIYYPRPKRYFNYFCTQDVGIEGASYINNNKKDYNRCNCTINNFQTDSNKFKCVCEKELYSEALDNGEYLPAALNCGASDNSNQKDKHQVKSFDYIYRCKNNLNTTQVNLNNTGLNISTQNCLCEQSMIKDESVRDAEKRSKIPQKSYLYEAIDNITTFDEEDFKYQYICGCNVPIIKNPYAQISKHINDNKDDLQLNTSSREHSITEKTHPECIQIAQLMCPDMTMPSNNNTSADNFCTKYITQAKDVDSRIYSDNVIKDNKFIYPTNPVFHNTGEDKKNAIKYDLQNKCWQRNEAYSQIFKRYMVTGVYTKNKDYGVSNELYEVALTSKYDFDSNNNSNNSKLFKLDKMNTLPIELKNYQGSNTMYKTKKPAPLNEMCVLPNNYKLSIDEIHAKFGDIPHSQTQDNTVSFISLMPIIKY